MCLNLSILIHVFNNLFRSWTIPYVNSLITLLFYYHQFQCKTTLASSDSFLTLLFSITLSSSLRSLVGWRRPCSSCHIVVWISFWLEWMSSLSRSGSILFCPWRRRPPSSIALGLTICSQDHWSTNLSASYRESLTIYCSRCWEPASDWILINIKL